MPPGGKCLFLISKPSLLKNVGIYLEFFIKCTKKQTETEIKKKRDCFINNVMNKREVFKLLKTLVSKYTLLKRVRLKS